MLSFYHTLKQNSAFKVLLAVLLLCFLLPEATVWAKGKGFLARQEPSLRRFYERQGLSKQQINQLFTKEKASKKSKSKKRKLSKRQRRKKKPGVTPVKNDSQKVARSDKANRLKEKTKVAGVKPTGEAAPTTAIEPQPLAKKPSPELKTAVATTTAPQTLEEKLKGVEQALDKSLHASKDRARTRLRDWQEYYEAAEKNLSKTTIDPRLTLPVQEQQAILNFFHGRLTVNHMRARQAATEVFGELPGL